RQPRPEAEAPRPAACTPRQPAAAIVGQPKLFRHRRDRAVTFLSRDANNVETIKARLAAAELVLTQAQQNLVEASLSASLSASPAAAVSKLRKAVDDAN